MYCVDTLSFRRLTPSFQIRTVSDKSYKGALLKTVLVPLSIAMAALSKGIQSMIAWTVRMWNI